MRTKLVMLAVMLAVVVFGAVALEVVAESDGWDGSDRLDRLDGADGLVIWKKECPAHLGKIEIIDMGTSLLVMCLAVD